MQMRSEVARPATGGDNMSKFSRDELICPYCGEVQQCHEPEEITCDIANTDCEFCGRNFDYSVDVVREYFSFGESEDDND